MSKTLLNVADLRRRSWVNGPGCRSVIWVQGCSLQCPGCFNVHTHAHEPRWLVDPEELAGHLLKIQDTNGITISGGEPFEQAEACAILAETIRAADRSVMVFSGYPYAYLQKSTLTTIKRFLAAIDLLVAGPYDRNQKADGTFWRASTNQTVHLLTPRLAQSVASLAPCSPVVEVVSDGKRMMSTGFPDPRDQQWLDQITNRCFEEDHVPQI